MTHRFASIAHPEKLVYVYDSSVNYDGRYAISTRLRYYETLGDGTTQHTPTMPIHLQLLADCLFSLAQAMLTNGELADAAYELRSGLASDRDLEFAFSVKYRDTNKPRYYSRDERKISTADSARHDRRYERIETRHDGSIDSAFNILHKDYYQGLQKFALMYAVSRYSTNVLDHGYHGDVASLLKWDTADAPAMNRAFECCLAVLNGRDALSNAERGVANYTRQLEADREAAATKGVA